MVHDRRNCWGVILTQCVPLLEMETVWKWRKLSLPVVHPQAPLMWNIYIWKMPPCNWNETLIQKNTGFQVAHGQPPGKSSCESGTTFHLTLDSMYVLELCSQEAPHPPALIILGCGEGRLETGESSLNTQGLSPPSIWCLAMHSHNKIFN